MKYTTFQTDIAHQVVFITPGMRIGTTFAMFRPVPLEEIRERDDAPPTAGGGFDFRLVTFWAGAPHFRDSLVEQLREYVAQEGIPEEIEDDPCPFMASMAGDAIAFGRALDSAYSRLFDLEDPTTDQLDQLATVLQHLPAAWLLDVMGGISTHRYRQIRDLAESGFVTIDHRVFVVSQVPEDMGQHPHHVVSDTEQFD